MFTAEINGLFNEKEKTFKNKERTFIENISKEKKNGVKKNKTKGKRNTNTLFRYDKLDGTNAAIRLLLLVFHLYSVSFAVLS